MYGYQQQPTSGSMHGRPMIPQQQQGRLEQRFGMGQGGYAGGYHGNDDDRKEKEGPLLVAKKWLAARNKNEKIALGIAASCLALMILYVIVEDHDTLFVLSEAVHIIGILVLGYKLLSVKNSGGLSLKTQELTAIFLTVRLMCSFFMEYDVHTILDFLTLGATIGVIYFLRFPLKSSYQKDLDSLHPALVAGPCFLLACIAHPSTKHALILRILWAFCVYLEAVSVVPQLRMMQKAGVVEKFTAHYVFALGLSRFISCSHWVLQIMEGDKFLFRAMKSGPWPIMVLLSELVQTFVLADFCYYYVKAYAQGSEVIQLPAGVV